MYKKAAQAIKQAQKTIAFTGAGISVESGVPPFRGENGLWNKYDPATFEIGFFHEYPGQAWIALRDIFYNLFGAVRPNTAHYALAELEAQDLLSCVITQNIDHLHTDAGSRRVHEFHGTLKKLVCLTCSKKIDVARADLNVLPPVCTHCSGLLKPDIIFFGEAIPEPAASQAMNAAGKADCILIIGSTGTVAPANQIPRIAGSNGAVIVEINPVPSEYTRSVTDIFIREKAGPAMERLMEEIEDL